MTSEFSPLFPSDDPARDDRLLDRYFAGESAPDERAAVDAWLASNPDRRVLLSAMRHAARYPVLAIPTQDSAQLQAAFRARIHAADDTRRGRIVALPVQSDRQRSTRWVSRARVAAGVAILALAMGLGVARHAVRGGAASPATRPLSREVVTKRGQQAALDLADGSHVILAADSRLRIPADYDVSGPRGRRRTLYLEGKAYFEVRHDAARPFLVRTATAVTEDLGTEFVVNAYAESHATQVAVISGTVALHRTHAAAPAGSLSVSVPGIDLSTPLLTLAAGDVARLDTTGTAVLARNVRLAPYVSWTKGLLTFDNAPLREALTELGRWYDLDFRIAPHAFADHRITGAFRSESADQAIQHLALMLGVRVVRHGRAVVLESGSVVGAR